jgi:tetratricopeptide (TPR) repeat protein
MLKKLGIVALLLLCCIFFGCIANIENPDTVQLSQFKEKVNNSQEFYDELVASDPNNATAWCLRGMYYNDNYDQYDEALQSADRALELNPEYGLAWYLKGVILLNTNKNYEAQLCFQNATKFDPGLAGYVPAIDNIC